MSPSSYRKVSSSSSSSSSTISSSSSSTISSSSSSSSSLLSPNPCSPNSSSSFSLSFQRPTSSSAVAASRRGRRHAQVRFSHAELIAPLSGSPHDGMDVPPPYKAPLRGEHRSTLKRCPTPVLTSLADLATAHCHQLSSVWKESEAGLPSLEADQRAIAASRRGEIDPFDF